MASIIERDESSHREKPVWFVRQSEKNDEWFSGCILLFDQTVKEGEEFVRRITQNNLFRLFGLIQFLFCLHSDDHFDPTSASRSSP